MHQYSHQHHGSRRIPNVNQARNHDPSGYLSSGSESAVSPSPPRHYPTALPVPSAVEHLGPDHINRPNYFPTSHNSQFSGQTIRMQICEIQKADLGRKYARVDRRPLDPPPVVQLRLFRVVDPESEHPTQVELDYSDLQLPGLLCTTDLFAIRPAAADVAQRTPRHEDYGDYPASAPATRTSFFPASSSSSGMSSGRQSLPPLGGHGPVSVDQDFYTHPIEGYTISESSKRTNALVGATFVQPHLVDYQGRKAIVFVFSDLAVKIEGRFMLRYRVFDIFMRQDIPITAQCHGGSFRVYSTKEFPGLSASTELTKTLARWGVRLNIRETERRRRKVQKGEKRLACNSEEDEFDDDEY